MPLCLYCFKQGTLDGSEIVAVKMLNTTSDTTAAQELMKEAIVMTQVDHDHVIKLHGVVTAGKPMMLVLEYAQNNSLEKFLRSSGIVDLTLAKLRAAGDIADGMSHLEDVRTGDSK